MQSSVNMQQESIQFSETVDAAKEANVTISLGIKGIEIVGKWTL